VLSKPITRSQLLLGKYLGLVLTLAVNLAFMTAALFIVLTGMAWMTGSLVAQAWEVPALDPALLKAVGLTFFELAVVTAIALFFSTFSSPMLSAAFTLGLFVVGRFSPDLRHINDVVESPAAGLLARTLYWILPNLAAFDVRAQVVHGLPVTAGYLALTAAYALCYIAAVLVAATLVFSRRDFK
jgi:ABC-type transport system involved in multi-copper enzyme maturation permease subunit